jgi:hypothetical protein
MAPGELPGDDVVKPAFMLSALASGLLIGSIMILASAAVEPATAKAAVVNR